MNSSLLSLIGLTKRDQKIYESLLAREKSSIRAVAEHTGQNRGTVYESIKKLAGVGLVTYQKIGARRQFSAADPKIIRDIFAEKQHEIAQSTSHIDEYIADLHGQFGQINEPSFATFFEGNEGIANILRDVINTTKSLPERRYHVISTATVREYIYHNFASFTRRRIAADVFVQTIAVGDGGAIDEKSERRWLRNSSVIPRSYTIIYGTKVAFISLGDMNILRGIVIENTAIASLQREQFGIIWKSLD